MVAFNRAQRLPVIGAAPGITTSGGGTNSNRSGVGQAAGGQVIGGNQDSGSSSTFTRYTLPFTASWEPDFWGRVRLAVEAATATAQASAADLENTRLSLQAELASDYFQMQALDMERRLIDSTIAAYEKALTLTRNRFQGGVPSRVDVLQAETQLENARAQATDVGIARAQFEHAVAVLTGQAPSNLTLADGNISAPPPGVPTGLPSELLERRPDIAATERQVASANAQIGLARTAYYPTLSLMAGGGVESSRITTWLSWPSRFWSVGPSLAQTLFDFGRRHAQAQQAEAAYDATVAGYRQTVLSAFQEVEDNLAALRLLAVEARQQDTVVRAATQSLDLELERYKAGAVSFLDVINSQTIAFNAQRGAVQILQRWMTSTVQLIRALGGGWNAASG